MRALFGVFSLLIVLALVGVLTKKQIVAQPSVLVPGGTSGATAEPQSRQVQQQYKQALDNALQQARPMPDDQK